MKKRLGILFFISFSIIACAQKNQLNYYLSQSKLNSPLLKDLQNQVQSSYYDSLLIRAAYRPHITGSSYNMYAPVIGGWGYDQAITNGGNYNALLGVNKLLMNPKVAGVQFQNLQLQNKALDNSYKITEQELKRTIIAQYITVYGEQLQWNFNKEIYAAFSKEEAILKKLTQQNVYRQVDYLNFLVTFQQLEMLMKQQYIQLQSDYGTLNYLSGINDTSVVDLEKPDIQLARLPGIGSSVFFQKFELDSLRLLNRKDSINLSYKTRINLFADAGYNSSFMVNPYKNFGTSFGFSVIVPIYDGRQKKFQYSKIAIEERTRQDNRLFFTNQYKQQVAQLSQQLAATEELIDNINAQLKYTQTLVDVNEKLLQAGEVKLTDHILAWNNYITTRNMVAQNIIVRLQLINLINYWNR